MPDTIAAIATALAPSAIGIVRLSGPESHTVVKNLFTPAVGELTPGRIVYGAVRDGAGEVLDYGLCTISKAPRSYTGEDTAELQLHGSPIVLEAVLAESFRLGARQALAGEFTKRAFLNGKLDLTEAEAVIDLIDAQTVTAAKVASGQLGGAILRSTREIYSSLLDMISHFHAVVDWPDEDIPDFAAADYIDTLKKAEEELTELLGTFSRGKFIRDGVPCAIVGRPNVGKSSLLNKLVGYQRAIVTQVAGTTRDTVEERCLLGGVLLRLIDTAGIRETADEVEKIGVSRSLEAMEQAELIIFLTDGEEPEQDEELLRKAESTGKPVIHLLSKADVKEYEDTPEAIRTSAVTGQGIEELTARVTQLFGARGKSHGQILTNGRQAAEVERAKNAVLQAREALCEGVTPDAVLYALEEAMEALGSLSGTNLRDDVIERIFSRFCVGK